MSIDIFSAAISNHLAGSLKVIRSPRSLEAPTIDFADSLADRAVGLIEITKRHGLSVGRFKDNPKRQF